MKKFLVLYFNEKDDYDIDAEFATLKAAQKYIDDEFAKNNPKDYNTPLSWEYRIYQLVASEVQSVKIDARMTRKREVPK